MRAWALPPGRSPARHASRAHLRLLLRWISLTLRRRRLPLLHALLLLSMSFHHLLRLLLVTLFHLLLFCLVRILLRHPLVFLLLFLLKLLSFLVLLLIHLFLLLLIFLILFRIARAGRSRALVWLNILRVSRRRRSGGSIVVCPRGWTVFRACSRIALRPSRSPIVRSCRCIPGLWRRIVTSSFFSLHHAAVVKRARLRSSGNGRLALVRRGV